MNAKFAPFVGQSAVLCVAFYMTLTTLLLPALPSIHAAPRQQSDLLAAEPNDNFGSASQVEIGTTFEETIAPLGDADWFAFDVLHQGELQLSITNVNAALAIEVRVWNGNKGTVSNWFAPLAPGGDVEATVDLASAGRYWLEVIDAAGDEESLQPYAVTLTFSQTADADEPNNVFGDATPIALAQSVAANILPAGDVDWYSFAVATQGELSVQIGDVADDLAVSFRVWNDNKDTVSDWIAPLAKGGNTNGLLDLPTAGTYLLEVSAGSGERSTQPYTLEANFEAAIDTREPNDSFGTASPFTLGESIEANLLPSRDADWLRVEVAHHGELEIAITDVPETLAVQVRVWNRNKETISDWIAPLAVGGETLGAVDLPRAGSYYLEIVEANNARAIEPYTVSVNFSAAADTHDDNQSFGTASDLLLGQAVQANILPRGDTDWYRVEVAHQGELQLIASDVPTDLDVNFRVWNSNQEVIGGWFAPLAKGGNTSGVVDLPAAGSYFLEVNDGSGDGRSIEPFALVAYFVAAADLGEPNNGAAEATVVDFDTTLAANILPSRDADWYQLELDEAGDLYVLITNVAPTLELAFRLWDDGDQVIAGWVYPLAAGGNTEAMFTLAEAGTYYLEVVDNNNARSIQPYLLRISLDEIDPASITFTQTMTSTQVLEESESSIEAGTEIITTTTTVATMTTTVEASGAMSESVIITDTEVLTDTSVMTRTATETTPRTPGAPPTTRTSEITSTDVLTESAPLTETIESTSTSTIPPAQEITATVPTTATGALPPPPVAQGGREIPSITLTEAVIPEGEAIMLEGVEIILPTGWQATGESSAFRGLALNPEDLATELPTGPRLWVLTPGVEELAFSGMFEPAGETLAVVGGAVTFAIGDFTAVAIEVQETFGDITINRRYVYVDGGNGENYQFILEAPAAVWDEQVSLLEGILASIVIEPS